MGGIMTTRNRFVPNDVIPGQQPVLLTVATDKFGFKRQEIDELFDSFCKLDSMGTGQVFFMFFLDSFQINARWMGKMLAFHAGKVHRNSVLSFQEFLTVLWDICSADTSLLATWIFHFFNRGNRGERTMNCEDINYLIDTVWGRHQDNSLRSFISRSHQTELTLATFLESVETSPCMLFPIIQLQTGLRLSFLTLVRWSRISSRRLQLYQDSPVHEIIKEYSFPSSYSSSTSFEKESSSISFSICHSIVGDDEDNSFLTNRSDSVITTSATTASTSSGGSVESLSGVERCSMDSDDPVPPPPPAPSFDYSSSSPPTSHILRNPKAVPTAYRVARFQLLEEVEEEVEQEEHQLQLPPQHQALAPLLYR